MNELPPKILVVDDDPMILNLISGVLRAANFRVAATSEPEVGLKMAFQTAPDLVILDRFMPDLDGMSFLKQLRQKSEFERIPVLMLTSDDELASAQQAFEKGADAYLIKPFDPALLQQKIHQLILNRSH